MQEFFDTLSSWISTKFSFDIILVLIVLVVAVVAYIILRKIIKTTVNKVLKKLDHGVKSSSLFYILQNANIQFLSAFSFVTALYIISQNIPTQEKLFYKLALLLLIAIITKIFRGIMQGLIKYTEADERFQGKTYRSFFQVIMLLVYIAVAIIVICVITEKSPTTLLAGLGAITAVVSFMFHETILSFVSSIQISAYDLIRKGDWIELVGENVDGEVIEVSLHAIKVKNWDNSLSSISTNNLLKSNFKNWRSMQDMEARRIKRSIQIDANSVKFVNSELKSRLEKLSFLTDYFKSLEGKCDFSDDLNKSHITNLEAFKVYAEKYLQDIPELRKDLTLMVRTLEVSDRGLVLEIYGFSKITSFSQCEPIIGKALQDFLATLKYFDLKAFQISVV